VSKLTRAAEVDDLDGRSLGIDEQDVLGLEVAVDDVQLRRAEEQQRGAQLLRELARQRQRHAAEARVAQQVVEVVRQQLKDKEQVAAEHEVTLQLH